MIKTTKRHNMKVQVFDTYVHREDGSVMHFDIVVDEAERDENSVFAYGRDYLISKGERGVDLDTSRCRFCHVETPTDEMIDDIERRGYHIIEMDDIPAELPENPTRRDFILHLRGHFPEHRFADMRSKSQEELQSLVGRTV